MILNFTKNFLNRCYEMCKRGADAYRVRVSTVPAFHLINPCQALGILKVILSFCSASPHRFKIIWFMIFVAFFSFPLFALSLSLLLTFAIGEVFQLISFLPQLAKEFHYHHQ